MWGDFSWWVWSAFPCWLVILSIFSCILRPFLCLLLKNVYLINPCSFFNQIVCFFAVEFLFYINPLLDRWIENIFSHSILCLFILLIVSFVVQKLFVWYSPSLFLFFSACTFGVIAKKSLPIPMQAEINFTSDLDAFYFFYLTNCSG